MYGGGICFVCFSKVKMFFSQSRSFTNLYKNLKSHRFNNKPLDGSQE